MRLQKKNSAGFIDVLSLAILAGIILQKSKYYNTIRLFREADSTTIGGAHRPSITSSYILRTDTMQSVPLGAVKRTTPSIDASTCTGAHDSGADDDDEHPSATDTS